jgi:hypothetical protein
MALIGFPNQTAIICFFFPAFCAGEISIYSIMYWQHAKIKARNRNLLDFNHPEIGG